NDAIEQYLAGRSIMTWSADFPADDWKHISSDKVLQKALERLEAKGRGILLLHDIHDRTVAALPRLLKELKARGYKIVHVVPATAKLAKTPTDPAQWALRGPVASKTDAAATATQTTASPAPAPATAGGKAEHPASVASGARRRAKSRKVAGHHAPKLRRPHQAQYDPLHAAWR